MKKILFACMALLGGTWASAQIQTPQPSPASELHQTVGLTEVVINYSRPSARGRVVFGDLVPYDKIWRTGANANTTISFSDPVTIGETTLPAGTYALYTKPGADQWEVYFYTDTNNGGLPAQWDDSKVAARLTAPVYNMPDMVDTFTISIDSLGNNDAFLVLRWENTSIGFTISVPTREKAMQSIQEVMQGDKVTANDYYAAASYYFEEGLGLDQAREWIDKAVAMNGDAFWMSRRQSLIYAALGDTNGAIAAAKKSLEAAKKAGNADYVKMNEDSLREWGGM